MSPAKKEQLDALAASITDEELEYLLSRMLGRAGRAEGRVSFRRWLDRDSALRASSK